LGQALGRYRRARDLADRERAQRRAVAYLRAAREDGPCAFSLDGQRLAIASYIRRAHGDVDVVDEYVDRAEPGGRRRMYGQTTFRRENS
jgi:hypothetical protein